MNAKLLRSCALLWILGILGMWFVRALLALEPDSPAFRVAAGLWILGGLGYTGLGVLGLVAGERNRPRVPAVPADLSALIRRR